VIGERNCCHGRQQTNFKSHNRCWWVSPVITQKSCRFNSTWQKNILIKYPRKIVCIIWYPLRLVSHFFPGKAYPNCKNKLHTDGIERFCCSFHALVLICLLCVPQLDSAMVSWTMQQCMKRIDFLSVEAILVHLHGLIGSAFQTLVFIRC